MLHESSGVTVRRTVDRGGAEVAEHAHDWPLLSLFVMGGYRNQTGIGEQSICGPSAVLYRAGAAHRNSVHADGFEQIEIEFDPDWLRLPGLFGIPVRRWLGGRVGAEARELARALTAEVSAAQLRQALRRFLGSALPEPEPVPRAWIGRVAASLRQDPAVSVAGLAQEAGLHPSWLGAAYRRAMGESVLETSARLRVERAARLLRETGLGYAEVALESGFCDQSHMNRAFRRVLGRTPSRVRQDREQFR